MWEPRCLTTLWASTACYRDSFTIFQVCSKTPSIGQQHIARSVIILQQIATQKRREELVISLTPLSAVSRLLVNTVLNFKFKGKLQIKVADRYNACSNTGIAGSNPTRGTDVSFRLFCVFSCAGGGHQTG
jgi:hypothetical protein